MPPRRDPSGSGSGSGIPGLEQLLQTQNQLMQLLMQNMNTNNNNNNAPPPPPPSPPVDSLTRFLRLNPPLFSSSPEPIVADDWLRNMGRKLATAGCTDGEKVRFASHQLDGPAAAWWDNYTTTYPMANLTWDQFQQAFRTAHVSAGAMSLKKREFRNLRQGGRSVAEYVEEFNKLSRYAPRDVALDAAKQEKFLEGLNDELGVQLTVATFANYQEMVDKAIILEGKHQIMENRKRKYGQGKFHSGAQQKPRPAPFSGYGGSGHNKFGGHNHHNHGGHSQHGNHGNNHGGPRNGNGGNGNGGNGNQHRPNNTAPVRKDLSQITCFKCNNKGHYSTDCPENKNGNGNGNSGNKKPNPFAKGQVNHVNVEEVYEQPDAVFGKFLLNSHPVLVLFDTGASHSFISRVVVDKYGFPTKTLSMPIMVSSPGAEMVAGIGCPQLNLAIGRHDFPTDLIILKSQGLDVILGMDWMSKYEGNIDCVRRSISLTTPEGKRIKYVSKHKPRKV